MNIIPVFIPHLGCPNACVFCNQRRIAQEKPQSLEEIRVQIESGLAYSKMPQIAYYGGSFTALDFSEMEGYLKLAYEYVEAGRVCGVRVSTRPDCINTDILNLLYKYSVTDIELGVQSMDDGVLLASKRGHSSQDVVNAVSLIRSYNFSLGLQIMTGLPTDNEEKSILSAQSLAALSPDYVRIYPVCVIRDTELFDMTILGSYAPLSISQAVETCAKMLDIFECANIPVIRIGLNPTEELSHGGIFAGAYHPSLGEMVRSRLMNMKIHKEIQKLGIDRGYSLVIVINPKDASIVRGVNRWEINRLYEAFPNIDIKITHDIKINRGNFEISLEK